MSTASRPTLLVAGASGQLGRRVLELLLEKGAGTVIATTRTPEKLADLAAKGVDVRKAAFSEPSSLPAAFEGADRMLLISTNDLANRRTEQRAAVEAGIAAGVKHVVYTSGPAVRPDPTNPLIDSHYFTEVAMAASPVGWTALRNNIYAEITLMGLPHAIATGQLFTATGKGGRSYVTREDCARAAAAALAADFDGQRILDVSGPAAVTQDELAALASEISGRPVVHVPVPAPDLVAGLTAAGLPAAYAAVLAALDVDASQGYHAVVTPAVEDLTGRAPTPIREFLLANRAALAPKAG
ncbi:MAG TPA: NAD(P)H-binding protein [Bauldia sp.]|nr:NAD(P)H-binding protein [Bauldia sp.]